jgi:membrane protein implicated in regulation of membrane protease activity
VLNSKRKRTLVLVGVLAATALLCFLVPQSVIAVYFLIIFIAFIYAFVKIIRILTSPSEREKLRQEIWGER